MVHVMRIDTRRANERFWAQCPHVSKTDLGVRQHRLSIEIAFCDMFASPFLKNWRV